MITPHYHHQLNCLYKITKVNVRLCLIQIIDFANLHKLVLLFLKILLKYIKGQGLYLFCFNQLILNFDNDKFFMFFFINKVYHKPIFII
jgi:hypothetical protein